jgi:hypothetical protein
MPEAVDPAVGRSAVPIDRQARAEARRLARELGQVGMVLPGTLSRRSTRCGRSGCHCHDDPPQLHGPYWWWTRKVNAKTVTRLLTDEQAADYQQWFDNMKALRSIVSELEDLALKILEEDPRAARRPGGRRPSAARES